ncbi:uncharacterized protein PG998_014433 [Apiospora kogelbergensis]|uniref:uncharacterized protein n=1 Tax=Apiospora kogelbergensis TaxID=1337665 RepID=UPI003130DE88
MMSSIISSLKSVILPSKPSFPTSNNQTIHPDQMNRGVKRKTAHSNVDTDDYIATGLLSPARQRRVRSRHSMEASAPDFEARPPAAKATRHTRSIGRRAVEHTSTPPKPSETRPETPAQQYTKETCDVSKVLVANTGSTELLQTNGDTLTTPDSATLGRPIDNNTKRMTENAGDKNNASNAAEDTEMEVEKLLEHRQLSDGSIEILVKWVGQPKEDASFEPEHEIQQGAAETLYDYWRAEGGRTKTLFYEGKDPLPETYHVFKILHHEKKGTGFQLEVQWVGYPATSSNTSLEPEAKLKKICPKLLEEYWERQGSKRKASEEPPSLTATKKASFFDSDSDSHVNNQFPLHNQQAPTIVCENKSALVDETSTNTAVHQENNSLVLFPYDPDITSASVLLCRQCRKTTSVATTQLPVSATIEEREGEIEFRVVNNDNKRESTIILTGLKCIFQNQLPEMPKDYIARLVPFKGLQFAEIVFCAISSDQQVRGYGAHLMSHLKDYVKATSDVMHLLTYADNSAIGYFKKQGFTKEITLPRSVWMGRIKDYEGGTIMQCSMLPRVRYLEMGRMLLKQKECVVAKIRAISKSHVIHQPPKQWTSGITPIDPLSIAAIRASGWSPDMDELARQPRHGPNYEQLLHLLNDLQNHQSSWPFLNPVNKDDVSDYYDVIKEPMDLSTMEAKLLADQYETPEAFIEDAQLIFDNCRKYNIGTTPYTKSANKLERYMWQKAKGRSRMVALGGLGTHLLMPQGRAKGKDISEGESY